MNRILVNLGLLLTLSTVALVSRGYGQTLRKLTIAATPDEHTTNTVEKALVALLFEARHEILGLSTDFSRYKIDLETNPDFYVLPFELVPIQIPGKRRLLMPTQFDSIWVDILATYIQKSSNQLRGIYDLFYKATLEYKLTAAGNLIWNNDDISSGEFNEEFKPFVIAQVDEFLLKRNLTTSTSLQTYPLIKYLPDIARITEALVDSTELALQIRISTNGRIQRINPKICPTANFASCATASDETLVLRMEKSTRGSRFVDWKIHSRNEGTHKDVVKLLLSVFGKPVSLRNLSLKQQLICLLNFI